MFGEFNPKLQGVTGLNRGTVPNITQIRGYTQTGNPYVNSSGPSSTLYIGPTPTGNQIACWNGSAMVLQAVSEISVPQSGNTAGLPVDVYYKNIAGTQTITQVAWTNATTPPSTSTDRFGRICKSGDATNLLIFSYVPVTATTTENDGSARYVCNVLTPIEQSLYCVDTTTSFTPTTFGVMNGNTTNGVGRVAYLQRITTSPIKVTSSVCIVNSGNASGTQAIGIDNTTTASFIIVSGCGPNTVGVSGAACSLGGLFESTVGVHYIQRFAAGSSCTMYGNASSFGYSGPVNFMEGSVFV